jgi:hypothetical protein
LIYQRPLNDSEMAKMMSALKQIYLGIPK